MKNYANIVSGVELELTPRTVQARPDGGWVALASSTAAPSGVSVAWLLKADAVGAPPWQEAVGCLSNPPGDYSDAVSLELTGDGGYVLAPRHGRLWLEPGLSEPERRAVRTDREARQRRPSGSKPTTK